MSSIHAPTASLVLLLAASCASPPAPPRPPAGRIHADAFYGTPLTGTSPSAPAAGGGPAVRCDLRYVYARDLPALTPLAPNARLLLGLAGGQPLRASLAAIAGAGYVSGADRVQTLLEVLARGEGSELGSLDGAVPPGMTLSFDVELAATLDATSTHGLVAIQVWQADGADADLGLAILVTDLEAGTEADDDGAGSAPAVRHRLTLLEPGLPRDGAPLALVVPSPFAGEQDRALVAVLHAGEDAPQHVVARLRAVADAAGALAAQRRAPADAQIERRALEQAWGALVRPAQRRHALHTLARAAGARLLTDLALVADDATLAALVDTLPPGPLPADPGWVLERTACAFASQRLDRDELAPELLAVLLRHTGEVGRAPGALGEVLQRCHDLDELSAGLVTENLAFLRDSDPAARVRAFDWLAARGRAPAGFEPLAERGARRAALQAAEAQAEVAK